MPRLLVVEDNPDSLELVEMLLVGAGFDVATAESQPHAQRLLERGAFDLVIADLMLGSRDPDASWQRIRGFVELAQPAPVGVLTGWTVERDAPERHGVAFVVAKPCSSATLLARVAATLHLPALDDHMVSVLRGYFEAIQNHDYERLGQMCADDVVYQLPGDDPRFSNEVHGRREFLAFTEATFRELREPRFELHEMRPLPHGAVVEYSGSWREHDQQRRLPGAVVFGFRDDRIARIGVRVDLDRLE